MLYTIGEMEKSLGIPASTLRYYDKEGLLPFVERTTSGIRMFSERDYEWLKMIECMKKAGSVEAVKNLPPEEIPQKYQNTKKRLSDAPKPAAEKKKKISRIA